MMIPPSSNPTLGSTLDSTADHPFRAAPAPCPFDPERGRVPYTGQTRMRLMISPGLAHARIVVDPAARDLLAIETGDGKRPRIRLAPGEVELTWRSSLGNWLYNAFTAGLDVTAGLDGIALVLHPSVDWSIAVRGGLSHLECDLSAGAVSSIDIAGGCRHARFELPAPASIVPIRVAGGACHLGLRRPADTGVTLAVRGGLSSLQLDDHRLDAIGGAARLGAGPVTDATPRYELSINGGASDLAIARR